MKIWVILVVSTGTPFQWDLFQPEVKAAIDLSRRSTVVIRHFYSSTSGTTADGKRSNEELWEDIDAYVRCNCG